MTINLLQIEVGYVGLNRDVAFYLPVFHPLLQKFTEKKNELNLQSQIDNTHKSALLWKLLPTGSSQGEDNLSGSLKR